VTDLFAADLQRILWRPMTRAIGGFGIILAAALGVITFLHTGQHPFATRTALGGLMAFAVIPWLSPATPSAPRPSAPITRVGH